MDKNIEALSRIIDESNYYKSFCKDWTCIEKYEQTIQECKDKIKDILNQQENG